jgi:hypothetical protein
VSNKEDFQILEEAFFSSPPLKFQNIETRPIDVFWANKIFSVEADSKLNKVVSNLAKLVNDRLI